MQMRLRTQEQSISFSEVHIIKMQMFTERKHDFLLLLLQRTVTSREGCQTACLLPSLVDVLVRAKSLFHRFLLQHIVSHGAASISPSRGPCIRFAVQHCLCVKKRSGISLSPFGSLANQTTIQSKTRSELFALRFVSNLETLCSASSKIFFHAQALFIYS